MFFDCLNFIVNSKYLLTLFCYLFTKKILNTQMETIDKKL